MNTGTVKFYNSQKGFGFITPDERAGMSGLSEGQKVQFDTEEDRRSGKTAVGRIAAI